MENKTLGQISGKFNKTTTGGNVNAFRYTVSTYPAYLSLVGLNYAHRFPTISDPTALSSDIAANLYLFAAMCARAATEVWDQYGQEKGFESFNTFLTNFGISAIHYFPNLMEIENVNYDDLKNVALLCVNNITEVVSIWQQTGVGTGQTRKAA